MWTGEKIPLLGEGTNTLPMCHVKDVATLVKKVIDQQPQNRYFLAVDKGNVTVKDLVNALAMKREDKVKQVEILDVYTEEWSDYFGINLMMRPSLLCEKDFVWHSE